MDNYSIIAYILFFIVVFYTLYQHRESMTNKDLVNTLTKRNQEKHKKKTDDEPKESDLPIYGPKSGGIAPPSQDPSGGGGRGIHGFGVYPDIYGPDITTTPGHKPIPAKPGHKASDDSSDCTMNFNPDLLPLFPTDSSDDLQFPKPFLNQFMPFGQ